MKQINKVKASTISFLTFLSLFVLNTSVNAQASGGDDPNVIVDESTLGFRIPNFSDILTFLIRFFFVVAGIAALIFLLWGALSWVTSGGDKGNVEKARDKIVNAIVGVLLVIVVVAVVATLEQVVFDNNLCFGLTCPVTLPNLLEKAP